MLKQHYQIAVHRQSERQCRETMVTSLRTCSLLLACSGLSLGCAWGSVGAEVVAPTARYPVSMTKVVPDSDGRLLRESHELEIVAPLEVEQTNWNLVYGQALNEIDFSEQLNQQVEAAHGEAITHMFVILKPCSQNPLFLLWLFPFWPTCADVRLTGNIVRRSPASPSVSPAPATAAPSAVPTPAQAPQTPQ